MHLLLSLPATVAVADVAHDAKGASSRWMNEQPECPETFRWQGRYGAFSVSPHDWSRVIAYVLNQAQHHAAGTVWESVEELPD